MKKTSFVRGTIIASAAIILVKILGALYVIPFYRIIGEQGGALYSYAYNIYNLFLTISITGFPIAISKLISEYNTKNMQEAKEKTYKVSKMIILFISIISFLIMFAFAEQWAFLFLGNITGGNTIVDVAFVIRIVSFSLLIIPFLSLTRGYLQGHKFIDQSSTSQIIEQVARIFVVLLGSYLAIKVFDKGTTLGVGIALTGAFIGGLVAYIYLRFKIKKNKKMFTIENPDNTIVATKEIIKKFIIYSIPSIIIAVASSIYDLTDQILILRGASMLGYSATDSELIASIISTWGIKICMLISAVATAISINIIPHMVASYVKKDYKELNKKFVQAIQTALVISIPMAIGISILSTPVYTVFYGPSVYGPTILKVVVFAVVFANLNTVLNMSLIGINKYKLIYVNTFVGIIINLALDLPFMFLFKKIGLFPIWGASLATITGLSISFIIAFRMIKKEFNFSYRNLAITLKKLLLPIICMIIPLLISNYFIDFTTLTNVENIIVILSYTLVGALIFGFVSYKNNLLYETFGKHNVNKILIKLKLRRKENE